MANAGDFINASNLVNSNWIWSDECLTGKDTHYIYFWSPCFQIHARCNPKANIFASEVKLSFDVFGHDGATWQSIGSGSLNNNGTSGDKTNAWTYYNCCGYQCILVACYNKGSANGRNHVWAVLGDIGTAMTYGNGTDFYNNNMKGKPIRGNGTGALNVYATTTLDNDGALARFNPDHMRGTLITSALANILRI